MLAADLELTELDGTHWRHWYELLVPPPVLDRPRYALIFVDGAPPAVRHAIVAGHRARGAIEPASVQLAGLTAPALAALSKQLDVGATIVIDAAALPRITADVERNLGVDMDYVEQGLTILRALKRWSGKGLWSDPHLLELLPAPGFDGLQRTFDLLIPDDTTLLAYVFDEAAREVHASIIATKRKGDIVAATTHLAIADAVPSRELAAAWRQGHKRVTRVVGERIARPSIALFAERAALLRVLTGPGDQLGRELNARNVILDPMPTWLMGLLGGATIAAVATRGAKVLASMLPSATRKRVSSLAAAAQSTMKESGAHPFALLGFDPLELWSSVKHFYRR